MRAPEARRFVLAALVLASLWSFVPVPVGDEPVLFVCYDHLGLYFFLSRGKAVTAIGVEAPDGSPSPEGALDGRTRPSAQEIIPGVGACGVRIGDGGKEVIGRLGAPRVARRIGSHSYLVYEDLCLTLEDHHVTNIVTSRRGARTPDGIRVGSSWQEAVRACAVREQETLRRVREGEMPDVIGRTLCHSPLETVATGVAWHSRVAQAAFHALVMSLIACLCLGLAGRRDVWVGVVAACVGTWMAFPLAGILLLLMPQVWYWIQGRASFPCGPEAATLVRLVMTERSSEGVVPLAAFVGLFVAGRAAGRRLRLSERGVCLLCCVGALVFGIATRVFINALSPRQPQILAVLEPIRHRLLVSAISLSLALPVCFLVVASQRTRWWEAVRSVLGFPVTQNEQDGEA